MLLSATIQTKRDDTHTKYISEITLAMNRGVLRLCSPNNSGAPRRNHRTYVVHDHT